jgi:glutamine---fructose-6-phosphate transaminase (isomerizing)
VLGDTLQAYVNPLSRTVQLPDMPFDWRELPRLTIVACGTAYLAGMVAKYWFERLARLSVEIDIASEFRYREGPMPANGAALFVSQSGETIDTLAALAYAKSCKQHILSVVNVPESAIARGSDVVLRTLAGPEIGVASTKAFTTQLVVLACLAISAARARGALAQETEMELVTALTETPALVTEVLNEAERARDIAEHRVAQARDVLYLARGSAYPIALEGALKLKELSYIHAEGYAAGEMKHGPIALIDDAVPVIVVAPPGELFEKTLSNVQEAAARGAQVILLSDAAGLKRMKQAAATLAVPPVHPFAAPIVYAVPVQLLAYYAAVAKGTDVDQPRNLAKSVTVE